MISYLWIQKTKALKITIVRWIQTFAIDQTNLIRILNSIGKVVIHWAKYLTMNQTKDTMDLYLHSRS